MWGQNKGEFERRLKSVVNEVLASEGEIILFLLMRLIPLGAGKSDGIMGYGEYLESRFGSWRFERLSVNHVELPEIFQTG